MDSPPAGAPLTIGTPTSEAASEAVMSSFTGALDEAVGSEEFVVLLDPLRFLPLLDFPAILLSQKLDRAY